MSGGRHWRGCGWMASGESGAKMDKAERKIGCDRHMRTLTNARLVQAQSKANPEADLLQRKSTQIKNQNA